MLKVILFCAILAYLSGVEAQQQPQTWIKTNPGGTFFRKINDRTWQEFSTSTGQFLSSFAVIDSVFNNGILTVLFLEKDDGAFVILTRDGAFLSLSGKIGTYNRFADGFWGDANRNPINRMSRSGEQRTPQTIFVEEKNGRLSFKIVSYGGKNIDLEPKHHHHDQRSTTTPRSTTSSPTTSRSMPHEKGKTSHVTVSSGGTIIDLPLQVPVGHEIDAAQNDEILVVPEAWYNNDGVSVFFEISNELWGEFFFDSGLTEEFVVEFKGFNSNGVYEVLLRKINDGLFVFISGREAFASFDPNDIFQRFATGFWADRDGNPISLNEQVKTGPKSISIKFNNGQLISEAMAPSRLESPGNLTESVERLEVWTNSEDKSNLFIKYMPFLWVEFVDGVPVNTFTLVKVGVTEKMVTLKNNNPNAGDHSFVSLDSNNAYRGMTQMEVKQYATGSFSFLVIPN